MEIIEFSNEQQALIQRLDSVGGVVEFSLISKCPHLSEFELHKQAAILTLKIAQKRIDDYFNELIQSPAYRNRNRDEFFKVVYDESSVAGRKISFNQFIGTQYHRPSRRIIVRGKTSKFLNRYFIAGNPETEKNMVSIYGDEVGTGYSNAFLEPPYGLSGTPLQLQEIFSEFESLIFEGFRDSADIWCWSEDCSNYFDTGKEWWGNYFYTYSNPDSDRIIGILASTTD